MPLPSLGPIPLKNVQFRDGMGPRLGNGISPCFFHFFEEWSITGHLLFFRENFLLLVCEIFRAHEMRSQFEVTEMLECKVNLTV